MKSGDKFPVDDVVSYIMSEGNDLMLLINTENPDLAKRVEELTTEIKSLFDNFSKEVSLAADKALLKIKIKSILVVNEHSQQEDSHG